MGVNDVDRNDRSIRFIGLDASTGLLLQGSENWLLGLIFSRVEGNIPFPQVERHGDAPSVSSYRQGGDGKTCGVNPINECSCFCIYNSDGVTVLIVHG